MDEEQPLEVVGESNADRRFIAVVWFGGGSGGGAISKDRCRSIGAPFPLC